MNNTPKNQAALIWNIADILRGGEKGILKVIFCEGATYVYA